MALDPSSLPPVPKTPEPERQEHALGPLAPASGERLAAYAKAAIDNELQLLRMATPGTRNGQLNKSAFSLARLIPAGAVSRQELERALYDAAVACGLENGQRRGSHDEITPTIRSALDSGIAEAKPIVLPDTELRPSDNGKYNPDQETVEKPFWKCTDLGNAERLIAQHGKNMHYCWPWGKWLIWDGTRHRVDDTGHAVRLAQATVRSIYAEASRATEGDMRKAIADHARKSEATGRQQAMLTAAQAFVPILPEQLDTDHWLLNNPAGTLDLRTGQMHEHRREDLITKCIPVAYDTAATCPLWDSFLARVIPDKDVRTFLQRAVGYSLTGSTEEECVFFLWGTGANGKSTFLNTLLAIMGEYGRVIDSDVIMAKKHENHPTERADLFKVRFAVTNEVNEGERLNEARLKQITSGPIKARRMREDGWEFIATHKLWIAGNHKPSVWGADDAIWRRIRLIPFTVSIPEEEQDRDLPKKLLAELPGILQWALWGCVAWQREGRLNTPTAVQDASANYRSEMDIIGDFLSQHVVRDPVLTASAKEVYTAYQEWAKNNGERPMSNTMFGLRMKEKGLVQVRTMTHRAWKGIGLVNSLTEQQEAFQEGGKL